MTTFYDNPQVVSDLLSNRRKPLPQPGTRWGRLEFTGKFRCCATHPDGSGPYLLACECRCDCGAINAVAIGRLEFGTTRSCGCLRSETNRAKGRLQGKYPEHLRQIRIQVHDVWKKMMARCYDSRSDAYPRYGGRGIGVASEWHHFPTFLQWAYDSGYSRGLTIDRYPNNDGDYRPENCRWATPTEQNRNRGSYNLIVTAWGETKCLSEWLCDPRCKNHSYTCVHARIKRGRSPEAAIGTPPLPAGEKLTEPLTL